MFITQEKIRCSKDQEEEETILLRRVWKYFGKLQSNSFSRFKTSSLDLETNLSSHSINRNRVPVSVVNFNLKKQDC